ncbi:MAG TPA: aminomethyl-transferring glycine dehydrogenase subunit GcvPB [Planctomycetota bacterium]|nr:aminomethyl-transferring glycine dehydrogenase subunit GcvPB [Planctomycetota bacterium]
MTTTSTAKNGHPATSPAVPQRHFADLDDRLIFEKSRPAARGWKIPPSDVKAKSAADCLRGVALRKTLPALPELSELEVIRHYTNLSRLNYAISTTFYPLGSCTMKYNPVANEVAVSMRGFRDLHPMQDDGSIQGALALAKRVQDYLAEMTGLPGVTLHPCAGAQGELTALLVAKAYFADKGESRHLVLIPDSAHGTNPASCAIAGLKPVAVKTGPDGLIDVEDFKSKITPDVACAMVTNPNTLGLFEERIGEVAEALHRNGSLLYMDGANFNAIVGVARPGDFGVDMMHINLHKTFTQPHGGGGPGAGPICVNAALEPYLPVPRVVETKDGYALDESAPKSIGRMRGFAMNFGVMVRSYAYMRRLGPDGTRAIAEHAVLNANYLRAKVRDHFFVPYDRTCMHEFVATTKHQKASGVHAIDVAKRLIDLGFHPPTVYFPLVVSEAIMIEPTETESKDACDRFASAMATIAREARETPQVLLDAPVTTPVRRLDEVRAVKSPELRFNCCVFEPGT